MTKVVLTVDDSRTMRDMLRLALADAGFTVVQAEDGVLGLEALAGCKPDVIVTDINMPRMDGFQFIEEVRSTDEHRAVPILVPIPARVPAPVLSAACNNTTIYRIVLGWNPAFAQV